MTASMNSLTQDEIYVKMYALCKLQAQVDAAKAELEPFITVGETFSCELGKLTKTKETTTFSVRKAGEDEMTAFKEKLVAEGKASYGVGKPALRLTLNKEATPKS